MPGASQRRGPLDGVRILDLSRATAGPFGSMFLADLGAEVIKIETPEFAVGVSTRQKVDPDCLIGGDDLHFHNFNRNKKSLVLNLASAQGKQVFYDLVRHADVVYDNMRPSALERLGLDYQTLRKINPRIISCSLTGFGATGPLRDKPAFDIIIQAYSGVMDFVRAKDEQGRPLWPHVPIADLTGGMLSAYGIVAALYAREKTGQGQMVDVGMCDAMIAMQMYYTWYWLNYGVMRDLSDELIWGSFMTKDRYIVITAHREGVWRNFCKAVGHEEWLAKPRFNTNSQRMRNRNELWAAIEAVLAEKTAAEWLEILEKGDVPCTPLNNVAEVLAHPQTAQRHMVVSVEHPLGGKLKLVGNPVKMSSITEEVFEPAPLLGQHTEEVLCGLLGYSPDQVERLREAGVI